VSEKPDGNATFHGGEPAQGAGPDNGAVLVLGARSYIGDHLIAQLGHAGYRVLAVTRRRRGNGYAPDAQWLSVESLAALPDAVRVPVTAAISLAPIAVVPAVVPALHRCGVCRLIAFSSTSVFTKADSADPGERRFAAGLRTAESDLAAACSAHGIALTVFRPTLVYSWGRDRNISEIARFLRRFRVFPLLGAGKGLRQPVHAEDLARACVAVLGNERTFGRSYNLAGATTLSYRQMVEQVFAAVGMRPRFVPLPGWLIRAAIRLARVVPRFAGLSPELATRMDTDMAFSSAEASRDFGFDPRPLRLPLARGIRRQKPGAGR